MDPKEKVEAQSELDPAVEPQPQTVEDDIDDNDVILDEENDTDIQMDEDADDDEGYF